MIRLTRSRSKQAIPSAFRDDTPRERLIELMEEVKKQLAASGKFKLKFKSKWRDTKDQLLIETHGKCAYCETPTAVNAFGDVEHYRPKSVYWWLAYVYDNYLASCSVCNQQFKGNKFEHDGPMMAAPEVSAETTAEEMAELAKTAIPDPLNTTQVSAFEAAHRDEGPRIPNPYVDDPDEIFAWEVIEITAEVGEIELIARENVPGAEAKVDAVARIYGLNRPALKRQRFAHYRAYKVARQTADFPGLPESLRDLNLQLIESMKKPNSPYAGMIRYFEAQHAGR